MLSLEVDAFKVYPQKDGDVSNTFVSILPSQLFIDGDILHFSLLTNTTVWFEFHAFKSFLQP